MKILTLTVLVTICTALGACASSSPAAAPGASASTPEALKPPSDQKEAFTWQAIGTQNYECKASATGGWAWVFVAPEAELYNAKKDKVGTHGAGPHWTALDGSKTIGAVKARANSPRSTDIPWLLLTASSAGGPGKMAPITSVQRINTEGGNAPATGCASAADAGKISKQGYTADYVYFVQR